MTASKAKLKAIKKYNSKSYESLMIRVHKGDREIIQEHAKSKGKSINGLVNELLEKEIPKLKH